MKIALTLALILINIGVNAQYSKEQYAKPEEYVPFTIAVSTFIVNESLINSYNFSEMSTTEQNKITRRIYFTGAFLTIGSNLAIEYCQKNKVFKRKKKKRIKYKHYY